MHSEDTLRIEIFLFYLMMAQNYPTQIFVVCLKQKPFFLETNLGLCWNFSKMLNAKDTQLPD